ncbi:MAG: hypothetical protein OFPII_12830 [Osedax symbiont Rs1]|nr:MAG: hypothetical protein OFPII_12830 [Osedax symbiont Rs1]
MKNKRAIIHHYWFLGFYLRKYLSLIKCVVLGAVIECA